MIFWKAWRALRIASPSIHLIRSTETPVPAQGWSFMGINFYSLSQGAGSIHFHKSPRSSCYASRVCYLSLMPPSPSMQLNATMLDARASCGKPTLQLRWHSNLALLWNVKNFDSVSVSSALQTRLLCRCECVIYLPRDTNPRSCCHIILPGNKQLGTAA